MPCLNAATYAPALAGEPPVITPTRRNGGLAWVCPP